MTEESLSTVGINEFDKLAESTVPGSAGSGEEQSLLVGEGKEGVLGSRGNTVDAQEAVGKAAGLSIDRVGVAAIAAITV